MILALDQGTTSSRALLFEHGGVLRRVAQREFSQHFPRPGWVEHDAIEILETQLAVAREAMGEDVPEAIGITNQRETTILWERKTGKPVAPAIVWQDRRTAEACERLKAAGHADAIVGKTGLVVDAYFSATKLEWLLDHTPGARAAAERGELAFGTVDSWLVWNLTRGERHVTDVTNASRTMLFNIDTLEWDDALLAMFRIPRALLPEVLPSSGEYGNAAALGGVPIRGVAGDQHAALFGHGCVRSGMAKNTYGTGCFMLLQTGGQRVVSRHRLLSTVAWQLPERPACFALEGSVFVAGAAIQWLRDGLGIIRDASEAEALALSVEDHGGVHFVPAFAGLGAPYWDADARGILTGLTRGSTKAHIARAALEGIAFQTADVLRAMEKDAPQPVRELRVDGGATRNDFLMQFQADLLRVPVIRPVATEITAFGAARLAGLDAPDFAVDRCFTPVMSEDAAFARLASWHEALERAVSR